MLILAKVLIFSRGAKDAITLASLSQQCYAVLPVWSSTDLLLTPRGVIVGEWAQKRVDLVCFGVFVELLEWQLMGVVLIIR